MIGTFECDDAITIVHVSSTQGQQAAAPIDVLEQILGRKRVLFSDHFNGIV